ncbi:MAG: flagellar FliJ family protein [Gammaproteobacteria bacterium]
MNDRVQQLIRLADLKQVEMDRAAQQLRSTQAVLEREQAQLVRLQAYLQEYFGLQGADQAGQAPLLAMRGQFLAQLRHSVAQQGEVVNRLEARFFNEKDHWFTLSKVKERLMERAQKAREAQDVVRDKHQDEHVQTFLQHRRLMR